jgi:hypothetical protein
MQKATTRKHPCRICRRWFMPNPRLKERQKTCGDSMCKRQWHKKMCTKWNRENSDYFKSNYLQKKLDSAMVAEMSLKSRHPTEPVTLSKSRFVSGLPLKFVQEVIGIQHVVILQYFDQLLNRRFQELITRQVFVNTS